MKSSSPSVVRRKVPARSGRATSSRRGLSFCYTLIVLSAMLILGAVFLHIGLNSAKWAYGHYRQQQSLFLAEAAVDRAIWMMEHDQAGIGGINVALEVSDAEAAAGVTRTFESPVWDLASGSYQFIATAPYKQIPGTVSIRAKGTSRRNSIQEGVFAVLRPEKFIDIGLDTFSNAPCFDYAMFSDHNLMVKGNPIVIGDLFADGNITFKGVASEVRGDIYCTGAVHGTTSQPTGGGIFEGAGFDVEMPTITIADYEDNADEIHVGSWVNFTNGHSSPSFDPADPQVIFIRGTAKLAGNWDGCGIMVSTEGFKVTGNVNYGSPGSTWAFLTTGDFTIAGTTQVQGGIYCHNAEDPLTDPATFVGNGTPNIFGCVVADVITVEGDYMVEADAAVSTLYDLPGMTCNTGPPVVDIVAWERD